MSRFIIFFFLLIRPPPRSTPFPTRRSSDLNARAVELAEHVALDEAGSPARFEKERQDRKSTRLNSSHRCISYAVFCLKKKKTQEQPEQQHLKGVTAHTRPGDTRI